MHQCQRSAILRFRCDVPHQKSVRAAGETPVSNQRHIFAHAGAHNRCSARQHLRHARPALRSFVADHDHIAFLDFMPLQRGKHGLLLVKHARRAGKLFAFLARDLCNRASGREVAIKNLDVAGGFNWIGKRANDFLPLCEAGHIGEILRHSFSRYGQAAAIKQAVSQQVFHHGRYAADCVQILHHIQAAWF